MARTSFKAMSCSVARTLDVVGERWTPLIVRDILIGVTRFDAIQRDLGISRKVLAERLSELTERGVLERVRYQDNPPRHDYVLTRKGVDLAYVLIAMKTWGDRWASEDTGPPMLLRHERCGAIADIVPACSGCGEAIAPGEVTPLPGPGAEPGPGTTEIFAALTRLGEARDVPGA
ncbi:MAG TPA: helix-turn-helix domain-containing protein, partial [Actinomycetota bacterium]|nr:helix-turn-helix domain-containing protein [Actinomycetota bacterium]